MINIIAFIINKNTLYYTHLILLLINNKLFYNSIIKSFNITNIFKIRLIISIYLIENKLTRSNRITITKIINN